MVTITYFVHNTTTDNEQKLATGWLPGQLSQRGVEQAKQLGKQTAGRQFDIIFSSDLQRAVETVRLAFGNAHKTLQDDRLREANYGDLNGLPHTFKDAMADYVNTPFPNGESYRDVEARVQSFCEFLKQNYAGKHVAIVAHQAPQLALDVVLKGKSWDQAIQEDWRHKGGWQPGWEYLIP